jgi:hypothetical protein
MNSLWYLPATIKFSPMPPYGMNCVQGGGPITLEFPFKFMLGLIVWFQYYGTHQVSLTGIKKQLEREIRPINSCLAVRNQEERVWCAPNLNSHVDHFAFPFQPQCCIVLSRCLQWRGQKSCIGLWNFELCASWSLFICCSSFTIYLLLIVSLCSEMQVKNRF